MSDRHEWLIDLAWRIDDVIRPESTMTRFREMVHCWQLQHNERLAIRGNWRQRRQEHFNSAVRANARLRNESTGPPSEGWEFTYDARTHLSGWTPPDLLMQLEPRVDMPIPLCCPLSLVEKYAVMSAIHDLICRSRDPIDPWRDAAIQPLGEQEAFQLTQEGMPYAVLMHHNVTELDAGSRNDIEAILADVQTDIASSCEAGAPAGKETTVTPKMPCVKAWQAWRIKTFVGITNQTEIATQMTENGSPSTQGSVSRYLNEVEEFLAAGGQLPPMPDPSKSVVAVDPSVIEQGERLDHRARHQRKQSHR